MWPIKTNAAFLARTLSDPDFVAANIDTSFIENHLDRLIPPAEPSEEIVESAAIVRLARERAPDEPWRALEGFRLNAPPHVHVRLQSGEIRLPGRAGRERGGVHCRHETSGTPLLFLPGGTPMPLRIRRLTTMAGGPASSSVIHSPMPGRIVAVLVKTGDRVAKGQPVVILEAMKMEHTLTAPFQGTVAAISATEGNQVSEGVVLAQIDFEE